MAACSKALDFDSLTSGAPDVDKEDGGSSGGDGGGPPVSTNAFCDTLDTPATFCDDFDSKPPRAWDGDDHVNGVVSLDTSFFKSSPNALLVNTIAVGTGGEGVNASKTKQFAAFADLAATYRFAFDMRVDKFDGNDAQVLVFQLVVGSDSDFVQIVMNLDGKSGALAAKCAENSQADDIPSEYFEHSFAHGDVVPEKWIAVRIEIDINTPYGSTANALRVYFDNVEQTDTKLGAKMKGKIPRVSLGVGFASLPARQWTVRYDNFVARVKSVSP